MFRKIISYSLLFLGLHNLEAQYISGVMEYTPAPGQFINTLPWGFPGSASSIIGGVNGTMCLGTFGGRMVFRFEEPVENHPDNPFGVDFTIFGNPMNDWSEPGVVWVMKDNNGNGLPDDTWYELAGSDYHFPSTKRNFRVTYTNPGGTVAQDVPWTDQSGNSGSIKVNTAHGQPYYPLTDSFPDIPGNEYALTGTLITGAVDVDHPPVSQSVLRAFGYADNQLRGDPPYTVPDNPYTTEIENSGGDGFDISWAVDSNGEYVDLDMIHFVKVQSGVLHEGGWLGEVSTEITGAVDVPPDPNLTGQSEMVVIGDLPKLIDTTRYQLEVYVFRKGRLFSSGAVQWNTSVDWASVDENNVLTANGTGSLVLTASLLSNPGIKASVSTTINPHSTSSPDPWAGSSGISLFPNPATEMIRLNGTREAEIFFYDPSGKLLKKAHVFVDGGTIQISDLPAGFCLVRIDTEGRTDWLKLLKQ